MANLGTTAIDRRGSPMESHGEPPLDILRHRLKTMRFHRLEGARVRLDSAYLEGLGRGDRRIGPLGCGVEKAIATHIF